VFDLQRTIAGIQRFFTRKVPLGDLRVKQQQSCTAPKSRIAELGLKPRSGLFRL